MGALLLQHCWMPQCMQYHLLCLCKARVPARVYSNTVRTVLVRRVVLGRVPASPIRANRHMTHWCHAVWLAACVAWDSGRAVWRCGVWPGHRRLGPGTGSACGVRSPVHVSVWTAQEDAVRPGCAAAACVSAPCAPSRAPRPILWRLWQDVRPWGMSYVLHKGASCGAQSRRLHTPLAWGGRQALCNGTLVVCFRPACLDRRTAVSRPARRAQRGQGLGCGAQPLTGRAASV